MPDSPKSLDPSLYRQLQELPPKELMLARAQAKLKLDKEFPPPTELEALQDESQLSDDPFTLLQMYQDKFGQPPQWLLTQPSPQQSKLLRQALHQGVPLSARV